MADLSITAASVLTTSGTTASGIAGATITAGAALYVKSTDGKLYLAQADGTTEESTFEGIALHAALAGQPIVYQTGGSLNIGATTAKTTAYVLSAAAGMICPQADLVSTNKIVYVGYATDAVGAFVIMKKVTGVAVT